MARPADPNARHALIAAARKEFVRAGIRGARIEDITSACGLSKGAFYLHAPSKEALFGEMVAELQAELDEAIEERQARWQSYVREHGAPSADDWARGTERARGLSELELQLDRSVIELIWQHREVFETLFSGTQGTEFAGLIWQFVERETERVAKDFELMQRSGACRSDLPPKLFGTAVVGAWLLIARQLAALPERPDLNEWVHALQRLFREGSAVRSPLVAPERSSL